jgi:hypothetical protein
MADKTSTADLTVRASFSVAQAVLVAMSLPLVYAIVPDSVRTMMPLFLFVVIPIFSFLTSMFMNWFLQYMYCGAVSIGTISLAAAMSPLLLVILSCLAYFLPFLRSPVTQLFSELPQESPAEAKFTRDIWGYCFYLFWGGLYGQTIASGMTAACP